MGIFLNIFTVDLWEEKIFDFLDPIKQAPALTFINERANPVLYSHKRALGAREIKKKTLF